MRFSTVILLLLVAAAIGLLSLRFPYITLTQDEKYHMLYAVPLLVMLGGGALLHYRGKAADLLRHISYWCAIIVIIIAGYSYRDVLMNNRIISSLIPQRAIVNSDGTMTFRVASDGHFYMETRINNVLVKFMVDTGASDITLSESDAIRIGLHPESLAYTRSYHTANGVISGAPVVLDEFVVGTVALHNIPASVNKADMGTSLLGMEFFRQLRGFSVEGDVLVLNP